MLRPLPRALLIASLVAVTSGCYAGTHRHYRAHHHHHGGGDGAALAIGLIAGAAIVAASTEHHHHRREEPIYVQQVVYVNGPAPAPLPASPRDRVASEAPPVGFDAKAARAALSSVDLTECRAAGAPRGYGHAKVTFNPDGRASKVVVDTPSGLSEPAVKCVGDRLGTVTVPEYEGSLVTVGSTWFVP